MTESAPAQSTMKIPESVISRADIMRLERELIMLGENYSQQRLGGKGLSLTTSRPLAELAESNAYSLHNAEHRQALGSALQYLKTKAPVVHVSVASEPSGDFTARLTQWFRSEVHPYMLLAVGVSPAVVAGCVVRTANSVYDMSAGAALESGRPLLVEYLKKAAAQ